MIQAVESRAEKRTVGRRRSDPDASTPSGQWAWWLRHLLPDGMTADELAEKAGKTRSAGFRWMRGVGVPPIDEWPAIAKAAGQPEHWLSLVPPAEFVTYVKRYGHLPPADKFR